MAISPGFTALEIREFVHEYQVLSYGFRASRHNSREAAFEYGLMGRERRPSRRPRQQNGNNWQHTHVIHHRPGGETSPQIRAEMIPPIDT